MNLSYTKQTYRKQFPSYFLFIFSQLRKAKDPEEKARVYISICTLIFFFLGLSYDMMSYILLKTWLLANINFLTLTAFVVLTFLFHREKLRICTVLTLLLFSIQINVSFSIIYTFILEKGNYSFIILHDLGIGFLVCMLAALTLEKKRVYVLCTLPLTSLITGLSLLSPISLMQFLPSLCLAYATPPVFLAHIRVYLWNSLREKERLLQERQAVCKFMGMNEHQWDLLIDAMQLPRIPKEQAQELFETLQSAISDQLVVKAKQLLATEEQVGRINRKKGLRLTAREVQLCGLIMEGKSVAEISAIQHIKKSSVRANRTRLRGKLPLQQGDDLKTYLIQLVVEEMNRS